MSRADYDIVGIGIGPFNLGLAALGASVPELRMRFFERQPAFDWHPGMLIDGATLQVSFLADLVTLANPCSPLSFISYLKEVGRLYQFTIRDRNFMDRKEYNHYCKWVASRLPCLQFGTEVKQVTYDPADGLYQVEVYSKSSSQRQTVRARNIVMGVGTIPRLPPCVLPVSSPRIFHSSVYLDRKASALASKSIALIGSGQSAAEIFCDLVRSKRPGTVVSWLTRAERFFPMEYTKLTVEMASPDYIDHFFALDPAVKAEILKRQNPVYKGINSALIDHIYDLLYERTIEGDPGDVCLVTGCKLTDVSAGGQELVLRFHHCELDKPFEYRAETLILATGYSYHIPAFIEPLRNLIQWDENGRFVIKRNFEVACEPGRLFVQNAELHTHGFTAPDLSLGPYRNSLILNQILGREHFPVETRIAFQHFGVPPVLPLCKAEERPASSAQPGRDQQAGAPGRAGRKGGGMYLGHAAAERSHRIRMEEEW